MIDLQMGARTRLRNRASEVTVGPALRVKDVDYFCSVGHGFDAPGGEHPVEAYVGTAWRTVGARVIWGANAEADFALIRLNPDVRLVNNDEGRGYLSQMIAPAVPDGPLAASVIRPQEGRTVFNGILHARGDLVGNVPGSPVQTDQYTVTNHIAPDAAEGDSGMAVWYYGGLVGVEWAVNQEAPGVRFYYATPIENYLKAVVTAMRSYVETYQNSMFPPARLAVVREVLEQWDHNEIFAYRRDF